MRVLLLVHGSRGDVQPFLALAQGMAAHGWRPLLAAPARFAAQAAEHEVAFHPLDDQVLDLQDLVAVGGTRAAFTATRQVKPLLRRMLDTAAEAISGEPVDVVVHHPKALAGPHLAEALGVPAIAATLLPLYVPTGEFPLPLIPARIALPQSLARGSWRLVSMIDAPYRSMIRAWRRDALDLPARAATSLTTTPDGRPAPLPLHAWSRHLLPAPADWPAAAAPLGFWFTINLPDWAPSPELTAFLAAGRPPVYIGFGSMVGRDPAELTRTVTEAVRRAEVRAVLATGWGGLQPDSQPGGDILVLDQTPYSWLFPQVAAVGHHGGVGTVAAALHARRPQVIRPFLADQPFWARRVHRLGLGPPPLTGQLTSQQLADAITAATHNPDHTNLANTIGEAVHAENGVAAAVQRLTELVEGRIPPSS
jgi:sterol 3beta-glucosyltransferase